LKNPRKKTEKPKTIFDGFDKKPNETNVTTSTNNSGKIGLKLQGDKKKDDLNDIFAMKNKSPNQPNINNMNIWNSSSSSNQNNNQNMKNNNLQNDDILNNLLSDMGPAKNNNSSTNNNQKSSMNFGLNDNKNSMFNKMDSNNNSNYNNFNFNNFDMNNNNNMKQRSLSPNLYSGNSKKR